MCGLSTPSLFGLAYNAMYHTFYSSSAFSWFVAPLFARYTFVCPSHPHSSFATSTHYSLCCVPFFTRCSLKPPCAPFFRPFFVHCTLLRPLHPKTSVGTFLQTRLRPLYPSSSVTPLLATLYLYLSSLPLFVFCIIIPSHVLPSIASFGRSRRHHTRTHALIAHSRRDGSNSLKRVQQYCKDNAETVPNFLFLPDRLMDHGEPGEPGNLPFSLCCIFCLLFISYRRPLGCSSRMFLAMWSSM